MEGFAIEGSSLIGMNGLYERLNRDESLGYNAHVYYRNHYTSWTLLAGVTALGDFLDDQDWLVLDGAGRGRFKVRGGGSYLPREGAEWRHIHDQEEYERLQKGDKAFARTSGATDTGSYVEGDSGIVTRVRQGGEGLVLWKLDSEGTEQHLLPAHLLKKDVPPNEFKVPTSKLVGVDGEGGQDDMAELPWQIIGLQVVDDQMREEWRAFQEEVRLERHLV
jgi:hypothetical protein